VDECGQVPPKLRVSAGYPFGVIGASAARDGGTGGREIRDLGPQSEGHTILL
jgi:hypothetical protein